MKCPFITIVFKRISPKVDENNRVVGEETAETVERAECLKDECMIYDKANATCSLFSSSQRVGMLLSELKKNNAEVGKLLFERTETIGVIFSTNFQTLQDAVLAKLDLIRKSNEITIMGIDRTTGSLEKLIEALEKLQTPMQASVETGHSLERLLTTINNDMKNSLAAVSSDVKTLVLAAVNDLKNGLVEIQRNFEKGIAPLAGVLTQLQSTGEVFVQFSNNAMTVLNDVAHGLDLLDTHTTNIVKEIGSSINEGFKQEAASLLQELNSGRQVSESLVQMSTNTINTLNDLNRTLAQIDQHLDEKFTQMATNLDTGFKSLSSDFAESTKRELAPLIQEMGMSRAAGEQTVQTLNSAVSSLVDIFKAIALLNENLGQLLKEVNAGLTSTREHIQVLAGKFDEIDSRLVSAQTNQMSSFEAFGRTLDELSQNLNKSYASIVNYAQQQTEMSQNVVNQFRALEDGLRAMSEEGDSQLRDLTNELEKLHNMLHERLEIFKIGLEGLLTLEKKGFDRNAESIGELKNEYLRTVSALTQAADGIIKTEAELKTFTNKTADALSENINRVVDELSHFQKDLASSVKENIGRFTEMIEGQKQIAEATQALFTEMSSLFKKQEEQMQEQARAARLAQAQLHNDRAIVHFHRGNYEAGLLEIDEALKIEEAAEFYNNKGLILSEMGRTDEARAAYQKAIELMPSMSEIYNNLGLLQLKIKDYDSAIATFTEATKHNVNYALAYTNLGYALAAKERFDEAIKAWEKALSIDPTNRDAREALKLYKEGRIDGYTSET